MSKPNSIYYNTPFNWLHLFHKDQTSPKNIPHLNAFTSNQYNNYEYPITAYITAMEILSSLNSEHPLWWATDIASRNRVTAFTITEVDNWIIIASILNIAKNYNLSLKIADDAPYLLARATSLLAHSEGIEISYKANNLFKIRLKQILKLAKDAFRSIRWIYHTKKNYGTYIPSKDPVNITKSFTYKTAFSKNGEYNDPFFGRLSCYIDKSPRDWITIIQGFSDRLECYDLITPEQKKRIVPFEIFQKIRDPIYQLLRIIFSSCLKPLKFPKQLFLERKLLPESYQYLADINWAPFTQVAVEDALWTIQLPQLLAETAGKRIGQLHNINSFLTTCEANPWELMLTKGLRSCPGEFPILGYQHSVVPPASLGMFTTKKEQDLRPFPDKIFTTGNAPKAILEKYGKGNLGKVQPTCALRYEYLQNINQQVPIDRSPVTSTILVALEGLLEVRDMVKYLIKEASKIPHIRFIVRSHPVLPFGDILASIGYNEPLSSNISLSSHISVKQDLEDCDAVLYWGTTISLEAISYGRPVIHFNKGNIFSYDPLAELMNFKFNINSQTELKNIIAAIDSWTSEAYEAEKAKAQSYVKNYFHAVNDASIAPITNFL